MSVWERKEKQDCNMLGDDYRCPALISLGYEGELDGCGFKLWHEEYQESARTDKNILGGVLIGEIPESCPFSTILKALPETSEKDLDTLQRWSRGEGSLMLTNEAYLVSLDEHGQIKDMVNIRNLAEESEDD